jgi:hypothetical protein
MMVVVPLGDGAPLNISLCSPACSVPLHAKLHANHSSCSSYSACDLCGASRLDGAVASAFHFLG